MESYIWNNISGSWYLWTWNQLHFHPIRTAHHFRSQISTIILFSQQFRFIENIKTFTLQSITICLFTHSFSLFMSFTHNQIMYQNARRYGKWCWKPYANVINKITEKTFCVLDCWACWGGHFIVFQQPVNKTYENCSNWLEMHLTIISLEMPTFKCCSCYFYFLSLQFESIARIP